MKGHSVQLVDAEELPGKLAPGRGGRPRRNMRLHFHADGLSWSYETVVTTFGVQSDKEPCDAKHPRSGLHCARYRHDESVEHVTYGELDGSRWKVRWRDSGEADVA